MKIYHYTKNNGAYTHTTQARLAPIDHTPVIPANSTTEAPPATREGQVAVFVNGSWAVMEDHRGEVGFDITTAEPVTIMNLGPLPDDVTGLVPPVFPLWDTDTKRWTTDLEALAEDRRNQRDARLSLCDWTQVTDAPLTAEEVAEWTIYRQALRDVPQQAGFPETVDWPVEPE